MVLIFFFFWFSKKRFALYFLKGRNRHRNRIAHVMSKENVEENFLNQCVMVALNHSCVMSLLGILDQITNWEKNQA